MLQDEDKELLTRDTADSEPKLSSITGEGDLTKVNL